MSNLDWKEKKTKAKIKMNRLLRNKEKSRF